MVIVGLWVRLRLVESDSFTRAEKRGTLRKFPLGLALRRYWWRLILGTFIMLATYVLFYLMTSFTLSYGTKATTDAAQAAAATVKAWLARSGASAAQVTFTNSREVMAPA